MSHRNSRRAMILFGVLSGGFFLGVLSRHLGASDSISRPTASYIHGWTQTLKQKHYKDAEFMNLHIQDLVLKHLEHYVSEQLASSSVSPAELRREMENRVFGDVKWPVNAVVKTFLRPWKKDALLGAGYSLGWTEQNRYNVVALYLIQNGKIRQIKILNFEPGADLNFKWLATSDPNEMWLLLHGLRKGKSHPRLALQLFVFDGNDLRAVWKKRDIYDGKFQVEEGKIVVTHYNEEEFAREIRYKRLPPRYRTVYRRIESGMELEEENVISLP